MITLWWTILSLCVLAKIVLAIINIVLSLVFIFSRHQEPIETIESSRSTGFKLCVLIPLLREQSVLPSLFARLIRLVEAHGEIELALVTTQREQLESSNQSPSTSNILRELMATYAGDRSRIHHFHFPGRNRVVAEQLNYAIRCLAQSNTLPNERLYIAVYNADSVIDEDTLGSLIARAKSGAPVVQQSALFLANVPKLLSDGQYLLAANGLFQSSWTIHHELPRYLLASGFVPLTPRWLCKHSLVHCVTHGLIIRLDVLLRIGGFPTSSIGGEDLALGFILRTYGYEIIPVEKLENADTPNHLRALLTQLSGWFLGGLGYLSYWKVIPGPQRKYSQSVVRTLTLLGVLAYFKWLLRAPLIAGYLALSWYAGRLLLSTVLLALYFYLPLIAVLWLWRRLPPAVFPRSPFSRLFPALCLYWVVPLVHAIPTIIGSFWALRILAGLEFYKPKTER